MQSLQLTLPDALKKFLAGCIRLGTYCILFIPLFVYQDTLYPYIFTKIILFRIIVEIMFCAWIMLALNDPKYRTDIKNPISLSLTAFLAIIIITSLTGIDLYRSFWSIQERMLGILTIVHFWLFYLIISSVFRDWESWKNFIRASILCSILVGFYGLFQKLDAGFLLRELNVERMSSTLGNPLYLGVYALLHVYLGIFLYFYETGAFFRKLLIGTIIFNTLILILSANRTITIVLFLTIVMFAAFIALRTRNGTTRRIFSLLLAISIIISAGGYALLRANREAQWFSRLPAAIVRIVNITDALDLRFAGWQAAWIGFTERPILGWGWFNYNYLFNKHFPPFVMRYGVDATYYDHSHNQVLDIMCLAGISGLISYLSIFGIMLWLLYRRMKIARDGPFAGSAGPMIMMLLLAGYFIQNLTIFDSPAPLCIFYFSIGLINFLITGNPGDGVNADGTIKMELSKSTADESYRPLPLVALCIPLLTLIVFSLYYFNIKPLNLSRDGKKAIITSRMNFSEGIKQFQQVLSDDSFTNAEMRVELAKIVFSERNALNPDQFKWALDFAIDEMKKNMIQHPLDVRYQIQLGHLYIIGASFGLQYPQNADMILRNAEPLSPQRQLIYSLRAESRLLLGDCEGALSQIKKASGMDDSITMFHFIHLRINLICNHPEAAVLLLDKADYLRQQIPPKELIQIARALDKAGNPCRGIEVLVGYYINNLTIFDSPVPLCVFYFSGGMASGMGPNNREAAELVKSLSGSCARIQSIESSATKK